MNPEIKKKGTQADMMTKIKLCGLSRPCDIEAVNELHPDFIGFVFFPKSKRNVSPELAFQLKQMLDPSIQAVGVFVNEKPEIIADYLQRGIIDVAQLHGKEDEEYIRKLRLLTDKPLIQAFRIDTSDDVKKAENSSADYILLDSGAGGTGTVFDWSLIKDLNRPFFLAGGLGIDNVAAALLEISPFAVDISSGIETDGKKDRNKMEQFVRNVRNTII